MKKKIRLLLITFMAIFVFCCGCSGEDNKQEITTLDIWLEAGDGTYIAAQIVMPSNIEDGDTSTSKTEGDATSSDCADEGMPLVTIGHGYKGTMNSGGARDLSLSLAEHGIATIRPDYNHYEKADKDSPRINAYTLSSMEKDQLLCIEYMIRNYNIDKMKIGLYARSMGGRVAMSMANKSAGGFAYQALGLVAPAGNDIAMKYYMGGEKKWNQMKRSARDGVDGFNDGGEGYIEHQGLKLTQDWFRQFEDYNPAAHGGGFNKPVLVIYNTLDHVVTAETSKECAQAYSNADTIEVTTEDGHGYEMGYKDSKLKDELINSITNFFVKSLCK